MQRQIVQPDVHEELQTITNLDQHFTGLRPLQIDLGNFQWLARAKGNSGICFHFVSPLKGMSYATRWTL